MLKWTRDDRPRWDADKRRVFGATGPSAVGMSPPGDDAPVADEWWRVIDESGAIVGYGWLDSDWGDAQITFIVAEEARGRGVGAFIVDNLERAAHERGLNYIYNVVPDSHPDRARITAWLSGRGFSPSPRGDLRRRVGAVVDQH